MLFKVISLSIFCLTSSVSNAASNNNILTMVLEKRVSPNSELNFNPEKTANLIVIDNRITISNALQIELEKEISKHQKQLLQSNRSTERQNNLKIGLVYIHEGAENWKLQFTYGGYLLKTKEKIIITTSEIFRLKDIFANTQYLQITDSEYKTTRNMSQLGAILHH